MTGTYSVAEAIRQARQGPGGKSLRTVSERAGVSAGTINRIEKGKVGRPSAETLIGIARGLELNPFLLLVISGHVPEEEARRRLLQMFDEGSEIQQGGSAKPPRFGSNSPIRPGPRRRSASSRLISSSVSRFGRLRGMTPIS